MMYMDQHNKKHFTLDVGKLLSTRKNDEILAILENANLSDLVDYDGRTLLHLSVIYRNKFVINYLINKNVEVNAVDAEGETPLMLAIQSLDLHVCSTLLNAGADLCKIKNNLGQSALTMFIRCGYRCGYLSKLVMGEIEKRFRDIVDIVDALLSADCQLYHLDIFKKVEITKLMLERGYPVSLKDPQWEDNTALHVAAKMNDVDNVKILLQFGADKNVKNIHNYLPIDETFNCGEYPNSEIIELLLPDIPDSIDWIEEKKHLKIFEFCRKTCLEVLLQHYDVNLNAKGTNGITPLHYLAQNRDKRVWELLTNLKLNVDASDDYGMSVLHLAMQSNNLEAVRFLLNAGANMKVLDRQGRSPLFFILWNFSRENAKDSQECVELFMQNDANALLTLDDRDTIISWMVEFEYYDLLDPILAHLAIIEARGSTLRAFMLNHINANNTLKNSFARYKQELNEMKGKIIFGTVTFFKFLTAKDAKICKYVQTEEVVKALSEIEDEDYLHRLLKKLLERAMEISRLRLVASQLISECIEAFNGNHVVLENILDFLDIKDLRLIATYAA